MPGRKKSESSPTEPEVGLSDVETQEDAAGVSQEIEPSAKPDATPNITDNLAALDAHITEMVEEAVRLSQEMGSLKERLIAIEARLHVAPPPTQNTYTVRPGDTLSLIAKRLLGNAGRFPEIVTLNQGRYPSLATNPNHIEEGWVLAIP